MEIVHEKRVRNYVIQVFYDDHPDNPRSWDNEGTMVCFHKRYNLGDKTDYKSDMFDSWQELKEAIISEHSPESILPIYMYDHGGITISTKPFSCKWDSGQIGFIYGKGDLENEVEMYNKYLNGEMYGYSISEAKVCDEGCEHLRHIDSSYGFFNSEDCLIEAISSLKYV